ncbi:MAG: ATP-binding protein [Desulfurivibrionaceae bacterium]
MESPELQLNEEKKRRRFRIIILACLVIIPSLSYLESKIFQISTVPFPVSGNVLVFVLININVLLLLLAVFLVLRNLAELVFERKRKILGSKLRTKLVVSFISLSLIPTALLFFISLQFVSTSMDYWFNIKVEESLLQSLKIAQGVYEKNRSEVRRLGRVTAKQLESSKYRTFRENNLELFLSDILRSHELAEMEIITKQRRSRVRIVNDELKEQEGFPEIPGKMLHKAFNGKEGQVLIQSISKGELVRGIMPVDIGSEKEKIQVLLTSVLVPSSQLDRMEKISRGLEGYRQLMFLKKPIKTSLLVILLLVTLLIIFCAVWFGFYVARGLTGPIAKLADATRQVADGDLDIALEVESGDEMGTLVESFNQMTRDLRIGREKLRESNIRLDNRRRYTETILQNVGAGVISLDAEGRITTINRFAEELLNIDKKRILNNKYSEVLHPNHKIILDNFYSELAKSSRNNIEMPLRLTVGEDTFSLKINMTGLLDEEGRDLGVVLVFDNLTELEKAQRMAAWREVARRIAHEVKNPLTPIQLSAQRLRKRYLETLSDDREVFDVCTKTIINHVDELKHLVEEFSNFARMPAVRKKSNDFAEMVRETLAFYEESYKNTEFIFICETEPPQFAFDLKQMERVLVNLLDNAVASVKDDGIIEVEVILSEEDRLVYLEVRDNGPGVADEDKPYLFEPYFSRKKKGTGLGLSIAETVIADHNGSIRVKDRKPHGIRFIVEVPLVFEDKQD